MNMPEADVVEVVQCKDCKYYVDYKCYASNLKTNGAYLVEIHIVNKNDYCSYAERKDSNNDKP